MREMTVDVSAIVQFEDSDGDDIGFRIDLDRAIQLIAMLDSAFPDAVEQAREINRP